MFDDEAVQPTKPPTNLPVEPADMFAGVEQEAAATNKIPDALASGLLKRKDPTPSTPAATSQPIVTSQPDMARPLASTSSPWKKIALIIVLLVIIGAVGLAVWYFVVPTLFTPYEESYHVPINDVQTAPVTPEATAPQPVEAVVNIEPPVLLPVSDTDQDGLDDGKEIELGTDSKEPDTDNDALSDGDEVLVWKTNPLSPDTDGDGFLDGAEIKNGYSPTGPGLSGLVFQTNTSSPSDK